jgi:hypothetical protein
MAFGARITLGKSQDGSGGMGMPKSRGKLRTKKRPGDSREHLKLIRLLPSIISGQPGPNDPHHPMRLDGTSGRGMGLRNEDRYALPFTRAEHDLLHQQPDDVAYLASLGIDAKGMGDALWRETGDLPAMHRLIVNDLMRRGVPYAE